MKKIIVAISAVFLLLLALPKSGFALSIDIGDFHLGINNEPPPFQISGQPELLPIPGRYVYFMPDTDVEIYFYHGKWYRPYNNRWFIAESYNGPWNRIRDVPVPLQDLPRVFYRVPYSELRDNWEKWEREKYWDKRKDEGRERHPEEQGSERY